MKEYKIALAGNPNVGKSTIFNSLTGMHQHTGNWPGKTVENAEGEYIFNNKKYTLIDIPGTYSLMSHSEEEEIARNYICFGNPDVTVVVLDGTCLERNFNLLFQIMEITEKVIICVNLLDEAKKKEIYIDLKKLEKILGMPVIGTIAQKKKTLEELKKAIEKMCQNSKKENNKKIEKTNFKIEYDEIIENGITKIEKIIRKRYKLPEKLYRWISLKFIDGNKEICDSIEKYLKISINDEEIKSKIQEILEDLEKENIKRENIKEKVISEIVKKSERVNKEVTKYKKEDYSQKDRKIDKILTSKKWGIPIMILFLGVIFWITIVGANYPSQLLFTGFSWIQEKILNFLQFINCPEWIINPLIFGIYQTLTWVISVMLPPMAIFFPLFTILEDLGYLPRIAFNLDGFFKKACCNGKQAITMCMGFGCNSCGVTGCRIIDSPRERLIAILTNNFIPCNGRFPFLITIASIFIAGSFSGIGASIISTISVIGIIILGIILSFFISKILSKTLLKGKPSSFVLELPPYRKPQFIRIIIRSIFDRTLFVLGRAISVAIPAGLVIWIFANIGAGGESILTIVANFLDPFAKLMGLDGYILTAFILGIPANEIVLPIILMSYLAGNTLVDIEDTQTIAKILMDNGWNILTALNVMIFTILHFPCATTLLTIKKETGSIKWTLISFLLPTLCGVVICMVTTAIYNIFV